MPRASRSNSCPSVGLDIVETGRIERLGRSNGRFLKRVFTSEEIRYCEGKANKWQHYAVRFAAKEAVWKALGLSGLGLRDIAVLRDGRGRPAVALEGRPAPHIQLSLTHSRNYAAAVALVAPSRAWKP